MGRYDHDMTELTAAAAYEEARRTRELLEAHFRPLQAPPPAKTPTRPATLLRVAMLGLAVGLFIAVARGL